MIVGPLIAILLAGNLFFIRGLISKLDLTAGTSEALKVTSAEIKSELEGVKGQVTGVSNQLREIKQEVKDLKKIELDVAVLKAVLDHRSNGPRASRQASNGAPRAKMKLQNPDKA